MPAFDAWSEMLATTPSSLLMVLIFSNLVPSGPRGSGVEQRATGAERQSRGAFARGREKIPARPPEAVVWIAIVEAHRRLLPIDTVSRVNGSDVTPMSAGCTISAG